MSEIRKVETPSVIDRVLQQAIVQILTPIKKDIKRNIIRDIHEIIKDYYGLNEEIEMPSGISI